MPKFLSVGSPLLTCRPAEWRPDSVATVTGAADQDEDQDGAGPDGDGAALHAGQHRRALG